MKITIDITDEEVAVLKMTEYYHRFHEQKDCYSYIIPHKILKAVDKAKSQKKAKR